MRIVPLMLALLAACAGRQTAWVTAEPRELPDGGEAFVLANGAALHLSDVEYVEGHVYGTVVRAWQLPPVGVTALAGDARTMSPDDIARGAGWPELGIKRQRIDIPVFAIRSTRVAVELEPDPEEDKLASQVLGTVAVALSVALLESRCCKTSRWQCRH